MTSRLAIEISSIALRIHLVSNNALFMIIYMCVKVFGVNGCAFTVLGVCYA